MYIVEGNIGAGKSTFLRLIQEKVPQIAVVFEPHLTWQNQIYGQSILTNFYKDPHRWAYTMETLAMACRFKDHIAEQKKENPLRLMERSIYSGHYVFATNDYHNGFLSDLEWKVYLQCFNFLVRGQCKPPQGFIYLKVSPEIAYERIKRRNRLSEKSISLAYVKQVHECHEQFLIQKKEILSELHKVPILTLECNEEFETDEDMFDSLVAQVTSFMHISKVPPPSHSSSITSF